MTEEDYKNKFREPSKGSTENSQEFKGEKEADTRAGRALTLALDIRKFEIELYWKRATYFWGFIAVAFTGHALTYKTASDHEPWLSLLFSSLGLIFSWAWFLVNRGSKFWQQNWEGHVDLLENLTLGPLYKTLVVHSDKKCFLVAAGRFSVSKINQLLSFFITIIWIILYLKAIFPISTVLKTEFFKIIITFFTMISAWIIWYFGRSTLIETKKHLETRKHTVYPIKSAGIEWDILNKEALKLHTDLNYGQAEEVAQKALEIAEQNVGPNHPDVATSLDSLAMMYKSQVDRHYEYHRSTGLESYDKPPEAYFRAEAFFKRSLAIREKAFGPDHLDVATSLDSLAMLYKCMGDHYCEERYPQGDYANTEPPDYYLKAKALYKDSLTIREKALGLDHPEVTTSLDNLAMLYRSLGDCNRNANARPEDEHFKTMLLDDYFKAALYYKRSLSIQEKAYGPDSPHLRGILYKLYLFYESRNDKYHANRFYGRSLTITQKSQLAELEKALGPSHPTVAESLTALANLYRTQNDYAKAVPLYIRSLLILENTLGPDHPDVATSLENLAALYRATQHDSEAVDLEQRAAKIRARSSPGTQGTVISS